LRPNAVAPLRWVADTVTLVRRDPGAIDWDALIAFARRERALLRLSLAIPYLAREFALPVEERIVRQLAAHRPDALERIESHLLDAPGGAKWWAAKLMRVVVDGRLRALPAAIEGVVRIGVFRKLATR